VSKKYLFRYNNIQKKILKRYRANVNTLTVNEEPVDKGKPSEREGRKAMGLSLTRGKTARLPKQVFVSESVFIASKI
jgi:hypothetical protein